MSAVNLPTAGQASYPAARRMPVIAVAMSIALSQASSVMAEGSVERGKALYENHCSECHGMSVHQRENRRVYTRDELRGWVALWSEHAGVEWWAEDIEDVARYLSRDVYGLTR